MLQTKYYTIAKTGAIVGGNARYSANLTNGQIGYAGSIEISVLFYHKVLPFKGVYKANPALLLSSNVPPVGGRLYFGPATFTVTAINGKKITTSIEIVGQNIKGTAVFDASRKYIDLESVDGTGSLYGFSFKVVVRRA